MNYLIYDTFISELFSGRISFSANSFKLALMKPTYTKSKIKKDCESVATNGEHISFEDDIKQYEVDCDGYNDQQQEFSMSLDISSDNNARTINFILGQDVEWKNLTTEYLSFVLYFTDELQFDNGEEETTESISCPIACFYYDKKVTVEKTDIKIAKNQNLLQLSI